MARHQASARRAGRQGAAAATIRFTAGLGRLRGRDPGRAVWSPVAALVIYGLLAVYYLFEHLPDPAAAEPAAGKPPDG